MDKKPVLYLYNLLRKHGLSVSDPEFKKKKKEKTEALGLTEDIPDELLVYCLEYKKVPETLKPNPAPKLGKTQENTDIRSMKFYTWEEAELYGIEFPYQSIAAFEMACNYNNRKDAKYKAITKMAFDPYRLCEGSFCPDVIFYEGTKWYDYKPVVIVEIEDTFNLAQYIKRFDVYLKTPTVKEVFLYNIAIDKITKQKKEDAFFQVKLSEPDKTIHLSSKENSYSQVLGLDLRELFDINTIL
ncbi:MAG: hypothetical protein RML94_06490 [Bacteroidia bacterium]|nr:hypothetical protein [Bacteroidia bacterium]